MMQQRASSGRVSDFKYPIYPLKKPPPPTSDTTLSTAISAAASSNKLLPFGSKNHCKRLPGKLKREESYTKPTPSLYPHVDRSDHTGINTAPTDDETKSLSDSSSSFGLGNSSRLVAGAATMTSAGSSDSLTVSHVPNAASSLRSHLAAASAASRTSIIEKTEHSCSTHVMRGGGGGGGGSLLMDDSSKTTSTLQDRFAPIPHVRHDNLLSDESRSKRGGGGAAVMEDTSISILDDLSCRRSAAAAASRSSSEQNGSASLLLSNLNLNDHNDSQHSHGEARRAYHSRSSDDGSSVSQHLNDGSYHSNVSQRREGGQGQRQGGQGRAYPRSEDGSISLLDDGSCFRGRGGNSIYPRSEDESVSMLDDGSFDRGFGRSGHGGSRGGGGGGGGAGGGRDYHGSHRGRGGESYHNHDDDRSYRSHRHHQSRHLGDRYYSSSRHPPRTTYHNGRDPYDGVGGSGRQHQSYHHRRGEDPHMAHSESYLSYRDQDYHHHGRGSVSQHHRRTSSAAYPSPRPPLYDQPRHLGHQSMRHFGRERDPYDYSRLRGGRRNFDYHNDSRGGDPYYEDEEPSRLSSSGRRYDRRYNESDRMESHHPQQGSRRGSDNYDHSRYHDDSRGSGMSYHNHDREESMHHSSSRRRSSNGSSYHHHDSQVQHSWSEREQQDDRGGSSRRSGRTTQRRGSNHSSISLRRAETYPAPRNKTEEYTYYAAHHNLKKEDSQHSRESQSLVEDKDGRFVEFNSSNSRPGAYAAVGGLKDAKKDYGVASASAASLKQGSYHSDRDDNKNSSEDLQEDVYLEVAPGVKERLRRTDETKKAIESDFYDSAACWACCTSPLFCIADVAFFVCPKCKCISPLENPERARQIRQHGVGIAFTRDTLLKVQEEIAEENRPHEQQQQHEARWSS